jgi:hypothetical protein
MKPFFVRNMGLDCADAFRGAQRMSKLIDGDGGSLADKTGYLEVAAPEGQEAKFAQRLIDARDPRFDHPSKPAGAVKLAKPEWLFFGWA